MSLKKSCSCRFFVPVETTIRLPERMAGTKYASVFPVPVPASTSRCFRSASADSIASAISDWPWRNSNCGCHWESGPLREKKWRAVSALADVGMGQLYYRSCPIMDRIPYGLRRARRTTQCRTKERAGAARSGTRADSLCRGKRVGGDGGEAGEFAHRLLAGRGGAVLRAA